MATTRQGVMQEDLGIVRVLGPLTGASIAATVTQIGSSVVRMLLRPGTWDINANLTIPENIELDVPSGTVLQVAVTRTLTINGPRRWPLQHIFTGAGNVVLGSLIGEIYPQWFGVKGDNSTDNVTPFTRCFEASPGGARIYLHPGTYRVSTTLQNKLKSGMTIRGAGKGQSLLRYTRNPAGLADPGAEHGYEMLLQTTAVGYVAFEDLSFDSTATTAQLDAQPSGQIRGHGAVALTDANHVRFTRCEASNFAGTPFVVGMVGGTVHTDVTFEHCRVFDSYRFGLYAARCTNVKFLHNTLDNLHPYDSNADGIYDSEWGDGCNATGCGGVIFEGNHVSRCSRIGLLMEGSIGESGVEAVFNGNVVRSCGIGNPVETGAAIWVENTTGPVSIDANILIDNKMGVFLTDSVQWASISGGVIDLSTNVVIPAGQPTAYLGAITARAISTSISGVMIRVEGAVAAKVFIWRGRADAAAQGLAISGCEIEAPAVFRLIEMEILGIAESFAFVGNNVRRTPQFFNTSGFTVRQTNISGNIFANHNFASSGAVFGAMVGRVVFANNEFTSDSADADMSLIFHVSADPLVIANNVFHLMSLPTSTKVLNITGGAPVTISGNQFASTAVKVTVNAASARLTIQGNHFSGASGNHVSSVAHAKLLFIGNMTEGATSTPVVLNPGSLDTLLTLNHVSEATLSTGGTDTQQTYNFLAGVWTP